MFIEESRIIVEEQDRAYYESLKADQEKVGIKQLASKTKTFILFYRLHREREVNKRMKSC